MRRSTLSRSLHVFLLVGFITAPVLFAGAQNLGGAGSIQGKVLDPTGAVISGAGVAISNPVSGLQRTTTTDADGEFVFRNVPYNRYHLALKATGFELTQQDVEVSNSVPIELNLTMPVSGSSTSIEVKDSGDLIETEPSAHTDVDERLIARLPMENTANGLSQAITLSSPGVVADSNGFFHPLGDHAQTSFSIDSQNISDQQSRVYSNQVSMSAIQSLELITGIPPAEYGDKTSLVAVATTKSGLGLDRPMGSVTANYGSFGSTGSTINLGFGSAKYGNFLSATGLRTGRFLDPPEFQALHDIGNSENIFDRLDYQASASDTLRLNLFVARSWFQIPNTYDQAAVSQDQRQLTKTFNLAPSWTHLFSNTTLLSANAFLRQDRVQYYPSANPFSDQPETVSQGRRLTNSGFHVDLSYVRSHHSLKAGFQFSRTDLSENFAFGITDPTVNPVCLNSTGGPVLDPSITDPAVCAGLGFTPNTPANGFAPGLVPFDLTRGGKLFLFHQTGAINQEAAYIQDTVTLGKLTANLGLRADNYDGLSQRFALQPRVGLSYQIVPSGTVLRAGYARTMETPYNENLLLSSSAGQGGLAANVFGSTVATPLTPGIRNQFNLGFQQAFGRYLLIDADYFWKFTHNAFDFNTLETTPIAFPIEWRKSKLDGFAIRLSTPEMRGFRVFTAMGHTRARFFNPEVGGLFFGANPPTGVFRIDHDQAFEQTTSLQYNFLKQRGGWTTLTWRYDSGLVAGAVPDYATALGFTADQQAQIGLYCGSTFATLAAPITSCSDPHRGALRVNIPADGTENDDKNPARITPRHLLDLGLGFDNLLKGDRVKWSAKLTVLNLTNKVGLYNFLSTFSGTHFIAPRSYQGEIGVSF